ncbi:MAG: SurA N-terminal domain-containing protein [Desulfovibrio sp.]|nr:SurA N-terminal domain-containing protein [Desulfovibrio sp.]
MLNSIRGKAQSFGVKIIFLVIIVVFVFWGVGNFTGMQSGSLATVNGENISLREYEKNLRMAMESEKRSNSDSLKEESRFEVLKDRLLAEMILSSLRRQEARRLGLGISDYELKAYIDSFPVFQDADGKFDPARYKTILDANDIKAGEFEADNRKILQEAKLMRYVGLSARFSEAEMKQIFAFSLEKRRAAYVLFAPEDFRDKAEVTEEAIAAYYEKNKESFRRPLLLSLEYLRLTPGRLGDAYVPSDAEIEDFYKNNPDNFKKAASFTCRHIFIAAPPEGSSEPDAEKTVATARATVQDIQAGLKAGKDFTELAREFSQDPESAPNGGLLPPLEPGQSYAVEFDQAALALKPGEVSDAVRTRYGFHLIRLESLSEASILPLAEVRDQIRESLSLEKAEADFGNLEKKAESELAAGTALSLLAEQFKVPLEKRTLASLAEIESATALSAEGRHALEDAATARAAGETEANISVPLNIADGIILTRITEARPAVLPSAEEMRAAIIDALKQEGAKVLAHLAAEAALPLFSGSETPEAFKDKVADSNIGLRVFPALEPLGSAPELLSGIFSSKGDWLPRVYDTPKGPVIARTLSIEPVKDEDWEQLKDIFMGQYRQSREEEAVQSFMQALFIASDVKEARDLLKQLTLR